MHSHSLLGPLVWLVAGWPLLLDYKGPLLALTRPVQLPWWLHTWLAKASGGFTLHMQVLLQPQCCDDLTAWLYLPHSHC